MRLGAMLVIERDKRLCARILLGKSLVVMESDGNLAGKLLAKLDTPLIKGVNAPHRALDEHDVLIERHEGTQRMRR